MARRSIAPAKPADFKATLWKAADKLRGSMDSAEYKHIVLGLVFLKYVSDAFTERRRVIADELAEEGITGERAERLLEDRDEYTGEGVFWVRPDARWETIATGAKSAAGERTVGELIDAAMLAIESENPELRGVLPHFFNRSSVDERRLGELVDLIGRIGFGGGGSGRARDILGEVYEYFLGMFAAAEGRRGGEYFTPKSVVRLLVEVLEPQQGDRVYDPCCGSGGMFVQAEKFIESHGGNPFKISVYGQEMAETTWRLAKMNLAIHGIGADLGPKWEDTFRQDLHPDKLADVVMANPPFNISDWGGDRLGMDTRWQFGVPPASNANFAWLQHIASKLSPRGSAGVVLANGSMSSKQSGEGDIRRNMVTEDLVACMVALPPQLFRHTQIPACLWFLTRDKSPQGSKRLNDRRGEVLFIDARKLGVMANRTLRELTDEEIRRIGDTYHRWRGTDKTAFAKYADEPGFCYSAKLDEIKKHDFVLTPGRYVGAVESESDDEPIAERVSRLTSQLLLLMDDAARHDQILRARLDAVDV
ncbi:class I SAM-dependent DNA methyltransferase [Micromonospora chokoriensis]|uniref:site-specific DNA-methyltransferase (adenine-specific) n=1 Tax=Micromonospora chokoriensis TaxID=356851 RepID=A0A1C4UDF6_9ACTN|nr:class I SAM-dependent DNA methyltransferase [Micromonospora chokoriensis]SCE69691.1 type I restriction enzyme M protein [Micromonospora chokoriensis]